MDRYPAVGGRGGHRLGPPGPAGDTAGHHRRHARPGRDRPTTSGSPPRPASRSGPRCLTAAIGSKLDPVLELADADGRVLAESLNGLLGFVCPADGTYAIGVHDKDYRGGADQFYRLHVGDVPVVTARACRWASSAAPRRTVTLVGVNLPATTGDGQGPGRCRVVRDRRASAPGSGTVAHGARSRSATRAFSSVSSPR